jgi:hypothetical protein
MSLSKEKHSVYNYENDSIIKTENYALNLTFDSIGTLQFYAFSKERIGKRIAIGINDKIISVPTMFATIQNGEVSVGFPNKQPVIDIFEQLFFHNYDKRQLHIQDVQFMN